MLHNITRSQAGDLAYVAYERVDGEAQPHTIYERYTVVMVVNMDLVTGIIAHGNNVLISFDVMVEETGEVHKLTARHGELWSVMRLGSNEQAAYFGDVDYQRLMWLA